MAARMQAPKRAWQKPVPPECEELTRTAEKVAANPSKHRHRSAGQHQRPQSWMDPSHRIGERYRGMRQIIAQYPLGDDLNRHVKNRH